MYQIEPGLQCFATKRHLKTRDSEITRFAVVRRSSTFVYVISNPKSKISYWYISLSTYILNVFL